MKRVSTFLLYTLVLVLPYRGSLWIGSFWNAQKLVGAALFTCFLIAWVRGEVRVNRRILLIWPVLITARLITSFFATVFGARPLNLGTFVSWTQFIFLFAVAATLLADRVSVRRCMIVCFISGALASTVYLNEYRQAAQFLSAVEKREASAPIRSLGWGKDPSQKLFGIFSTRAGDEDNLGAVGNPVHFSMILTALVPIGFLFSKEKLAEKSWRYSILCLAGLVAVIAALLMTFSRAAYVVVSLEVVVLIARERKNAWKWVLGLCVVAALAYLALSSVGGAQSLNKRGEQLLLLLTMKISDDPSGSMRSGVLRAMLTFIAEHPFVGIGFGNFREAALSISGLLAAQQGENLYLQTMAELGIPYWLLFWGSIFYLMWPSVGRSSLSKGYEMILKIAMCAIILMSATLYTEFEYFPYIFAAMLLGPALTYRSHSPISASAQNPVLQPLSGNFVDPRIQES